MRPELALTLGASPLPVVVAALDHNERLSRPPGLKFHLVFTPEVDTLAERVRSILDRRGLVPGSHVCVHDHWNVPRMWRALNDAPLDWARTALHYTGGTKLLSAHVRRFWQERNGPPVEASYLSAAGRIWWDDGRSEPVSPGVKLSLAEVADLHFGAAPKTGDEFEHPVRSKVAKRIHQLVAVEGFERYLSRLPPLYGEKEGSWTHPKLGKCHVTLSSYHAANTANFKDAAIFAEWNLDEVSRILLDQEGGIDTLAAALELSGKKVQRRLKVATWLHGDWLEVWLAGYLLGLRLFDEVHQDVKARRMRDQTILEEFQADVVAMRGHHTVLFTCTAEGRGPLLKQKLFEGLSRGARLGGEHARVALVCLTDEPVPTLGQVQELGWEGYDEVRVFGEAHVRGDRAPCFLDRAGGPGPAMTIQEALQEWFL